MQKQHRALLTILIIGWILRVIFALLAPVDYELLGGGDMRWYMANGLALVSGMRAGVSMGLAVDVSVLPTAPPLSAFCRLLRENLPA